MSKHIRDHQLLSYLEAATVAGLSPRLRQRVEAHISVCPACRARLEQLARTATDLAATLHAVEEQVPLAPARSWAAIAQHLERRHLRPGILLFRPLLRHAATLAILLFIVAGLAGLIHTLAVTGPTLTKATPPPTSTPPASPSPPPGPLPRSYPGRPAGPVALLVLGADGETATPAAGGTAVEETDALLLLYLDAEAERAFLLSIPRELYVDVPGHGQARAGQVYGLGEQDEANDGLRLAREAISSTLGLPVQHAALVRFDGFATLVDTIGGVDVEVPQTIEDPAFPDDHGGTDPLSIPAGRQHFDGALALRYARTRIVPTPGFDRAFRQRQLILAAHERVTRLDLLPGLLAQAPALWSAVVNGLKTDLSLNDAIDLALLVTGLSAEDVATAALDECCTVPSTSSLGERVSVPQPDEIEALIEKLLEEER